MHACYMSACLIDAACALEGLGVRLHQAVQGVHVLAQRQLDPIRRGQRQLPPAPPPPLAVLHPPPVLRALQTPLPGVYCHMRSVKSKQRQQADQRRSLLADTLQLSAMQCDRSI